MNDREFVAEITKKIIIMQAPKDKNGEDDVNKYFKIFVTWRGIEDYLCDPTNAQEAGGNN